MKPGNIHFSRIAAGVLALAVTLLGASSIRAQDGSAGADLPETFTGRIVDAKGAVPRASTAPFTLHVDSYSDDQEVIHLLEVLQQGGQRAVLDAMQDMESKGWFKIGNSLGYQAAVIRSFEVEGVRIIRVITDRPIQFVESLRGLRSRDYPFGAIEIKIGPDGKGQGSLVAALKVSFTEDGNVELTSFGTEPFRILSVSKQKVKKKKE